MCEILRFAVPAVPFVLWVVLAWRVLPAWFRFHRAYKSTAGEVWPDQPSLPQLWRVGHGDAALYAARPELEGLRQDFLNKRKWYGLAFIGSAIIAPQVQSIPGICG